MRTHDIIIGAVYRHKTSPNYAYAKALEVLKPKPAYKCRTEIEKHIKVVLIKCELTVNIGDTVGIIK